MVMGMAANPRGAHQAGELSLAQQPDRSAGLTAGAPSKASQIDHGSGNATLSR